MYVKSTIRDKMYTVYDSMQVGAMPGYNTHMVYGTLFSTNEANDAQGITSACHRCDKANLEL